MNASLEHVPFDPFLDAWIPTDAGILSPADALRRAHRITWPRDEWNWATFLLLHAMVQTEVVLYGRIPTDDEWVDLILSGELPAGLDTWFRRLSTLNAGHPFYQDPTVTSVAPVSAVFTDAPGESTQKKNVDVLYWRDDMPSSLSYAEALIATIATQIFGVGSGAGYYSGCRGSIPATLIVEPIDDAALLWERTLLNIMPQQQWNRTYETNRTFDFPWKSPTDIKLEVGPESTHPLEMLWQQPRRWHLLLDDQGRVSQVGRDPQGRSYFGWIHPMSRYRLGKESDVPFAEKTQAKLNYSHWAALTLASQTNRDFLPKNLTPFLTDVDLRGKSVRLRYVGWSKSDMEFSAWINTILPVYRVDPSDIIDIENAIVAVNEQKYRLANALKELSPSLGRVSDELFGQTEQEFFNRVRRSDPVERWVGWSEFVFQKAVAIFIVHSQRYEASHLDKVIKAQRKIGAVKKK